jgi:hypothetical protein
MSGRKIISYWGLGQIRNSLEFATCQAMTSFGGEIVSKSSLKKPTRYSPVELLKVLVVTLFDGSMPQKQGLFHIQPLRLK